MRCYAFRTGRALCGAAVGLGFSLRLCIGAPSGAAPGGLGGCRGGLVDGPDEERRHLGSGYGLAGAVVEGAGGTPSGYPGLIHALDGSDDGGVCALVVLEEAFGLSDGFEVGERGDHHYGHVRSGYDPAGVEHSPGGFERVDRDHPVGIGAVPGVGAHVGELRGGGGLDGPALGDGPVQERGHLPAGDVGRGAVEGGVGCAASEGDLPLGDAFDVGLVDAAVLVAEPARTRRGGRRCRRGWLSGRGRTPTAAASSASCGWGAGAGAGGGAAGAVLVMVRKVGVMVNPAAVAVMLMRSADSAAVSVLILIVNRLIGFQGARRTATLAC